MELQHFFELMAIALAVGFALPLHFKHPRSISSQDSHRLRKYPVIVASTDNSSNFIRVFVVLPHTLDELASLILLYCFECAELTRTQISGGSEYGSHQDLAGLYFSSMSHTEESADMLGNESLTCRYDRAEPPAFLLKPLFRLFSLACVSTPGSVDCPPVWLSLLQVS